MLQAAGAAILPWPALEKWAVADAGEAVLGPRLRARWEPRTLRPHEEAGRKKKPLRHERVILEATASATVEGVVQAEESALQTEGWGLGDGYPDVIAYLCQDEPTDGGASYLVDGYGILAAAASTPGRRKLLRSLWSAPVLLRTHPQYKPASQTLARRTPGGRVAVAYVPSSLLPSLDDEGRQDRATELATHWHELVVAVGLHAPRFSLRRGEVLLIDNYRVYHGREPYRGQRAVHRAWFWTDAVFAYPMVTEPGVDVS